jgi:hypothetical protein
MVNNGDWTLVENKANSKPIQSQTKPILWKGKSKKAKGKNESNSGDSPGGYLKKQNQRRPWPEIRSTKL